MLNNECCDICRQNDMPVSIVNTEFGSFKRCSICLRVGAGIKNDKRFVKNTTIYLSSTDSYYKRDKLVVLRPYKKGEGEKFTTRSEIVIFLNNLNRPKELL